MAVSNLVQATSTGVNAYSITATTSRVLYNTVVNLPIGIYRISHTFTSTSVVTVNFFTGNTFIGTTNTISGTIDFNLATAATRVQYISTQGSNLIINLELIANAASTSAVSGTLDTIDTTSTYAQTGQLYVITVGGGGGGGGGNASINTGNNGGGGGGSGGISFDYVFATSNTSVTIGAAGNLGTRGNAGGSGGSTTFGAITVTGGGGGTVGSSGAGGTGGTPGGCNGGGSTSGSRGNSTLNTYYWVKDGTTGSGTGAGITNFGGGNVQPSFPGGDGVIGKGGNGGQYGESNGPFFWGSNSQNATGYGAGGGGGCDRSGNNNWNGTAGTPGVVYVLRNIF